MLGSIPYGLRDIVHIERTNPQQDMNYRLLYSYRLGCGLDLNSPLEKRTIRKLCAWKTLTNIMNIYIG